MHQNYRVLSAKVLDDSPPPAEAEDALAGFVDWLDRDVDSLTPSDLLAAVDQFLRLRGEGKIKVASSARLSRGAPNRLLDVERELSRVPMVRAASFAQRSELAARVLARLRGF